jgi:hypothetical protein
MGAASPLESGAVKVDQRPVPEGSGLRRLGPDATVKQYKTYGEVRTGANPATGSTSGFAKVDTFVRAMYKAGKSPARAGLMRALLAQRDVAVPAPGLTAEDVGYRPLHHLPSG